MEGVTFLLANDLAGTTVVVTPHLSQSPSNNKETQELEETYPAAFPVCVVTRSQHRATLGNSSGEGGRESPNSEVNLSSTGFAEWCGVPDLPVVDRGTLITEQQHDSSLSTALEEAMPSGKPDSS